MSKVRTYDEFLNESDSDLTKYKSMVKQTDWYYMYSDDNRKYKAGTQHRDAMRTLFDKLSDTEQKEAFDEYNKEYPFDIKLDAKKFKGIA